MASGWDKHPGPDNDYAPKPWTTTRTVGFLLLIFIGVIGVAYFNWP